MHLNYSHFKNLIAILIFSAIVAPTTCRALSCYPLKDNFFLQCTSGACKGIFRAREVRVPGKCTRRIVVEPLRGAEVIFLTPMVAESVRDRKPTGYFRVLLVHQFYGYVPVTATELRNAISQPVFPRTKLNKIEFIGNAIDVGALKQRWQSMQDEDLIR
jgi:hypothetical protein